MLDFIAKIKQPWLMIAGMTLPLATYTTAIYAIGKKNEKIFDFTEQEKEAIKERNQAMLYSFYAFGGMAIGFLIMSLLISSDIFLPLAIGCAVTSILAFIVMFDYTLLMDGGNTLIAIIVSAIAIVFAIGLYILYGMYIYGTGGGGGKLNMMNHGFKM